MDHDHGQIRRARPDEIARRVDPDVAIDDYERAVVVQRFAHGSLPRHARPRIGNPVGALDANQQ